MRHVCLLYVCLCIHNHTILSISVDLHSHLGSRCKTLRPLHLACNAIRRGECDRALVAGSQVMNTPSAFITFSRLRALAPDGRCKSFSSSANGVGWAEGVCTLVLQPLSKALAEGRPVLGVIRGTAINQDGRSQGLTAPHGPSQEKVIRQALNASGLTPDDVDVIEAHEGDSTHLFNPLNFTMLCGCFGVFSWLTIRRLRNVSLIAEGDPRLKEGIGFENQ